MLLNYRGKEGDDEVRDQLVRTPLLLIQSGIVFDSLAITDSSESFPRSPASDLSDETKGAAAATVITLPH